MSDFEIETTATAQDTTEDQPVETTEESGDYDIVDPASADFYEPEEAEDSVSEETVEETVEETPDPVSDADVRVEETQESPEYPPELMQQANQLGYSYDDIRALGSPEALRVAIQKQAWVADRLMDGKQQEGQPNPVEAGIEGIKELSEKGFDEELVEQLVNSFTTLATQNQQMQQQMQQLQESTQEEIKSVTTQAQAAEAKELLNWMDSQFSGLSEDYQPYIGSGKCSELDRSSSEFLAREKITSKYVKMRSEWKDWDFKGPDDPNIFDAAVSLTLGDHNKTAVRSDLKKKLRKAGSQVTARPTHTQKTPSDPREAAAAFANAHQLWNHSK